MQKRSNYTMRKSIFKVLLCVHLLVSVQNEYFAALTVYVCNKTSQAYSQTFADFADTRIFEQEIQSFQHYMF